MIYYLDFFQTKMQSKLKQILFALGISLIFATPTHAAKLALSPAEAALRVGCNSTVNIVINTEGADTNAADAFLHFNPNEIEVTRIGLGNVYKAYPGRQINSNGLIRITAFNDEGSYNGRGVLATLNFKAKPGITSTEIRFEYVAGGTQDSNVANLQATDILSGVFNGKYTFTEGKCTTDTTPPYVENVNPEPFSNQIPSEENIAFEVKDKLSGVDLKTVEVNVNGENFTAEGEKSFTSEKSTGGYKITVDPSAPFENSVPVSLVIKANDLDGNKMEPFKVGYNQLMTSADCPVLRAAAPEIKISWFWLWIPLILSALLNLYLYIKKRTCEGPMLAKIKFQKHPVQTKK